VPALGRGGEGQHRFPVRRHTETYSAGDANCAPPGHTPVPSEGGEVIEFSPTEALGATMAVVEPNMAAAADAPA
jgi:hypothetical protein